MEDDKGKPLFQRAVKKFGALAEDEMFSFVPALATGGEPQIRQCGQGGFVCPI